MKHIGTKAIRDVGGELLSKTVVEAGCARIETIRRKITGGMGWHFRQPQPVLFLYRRGAARRLRGSLDGRHIDHAFAGNLALFPADMEIDGEFRVSVSAVEYTVVFFETPFVETRAGNCLESQPNHQKKTFPPAGFFIGCLVPAIVPRNFTYTNILLGKTGDLLDL